MALANTPAAYGGVAKTFHWLTALLILTAIPLGAVANQLPFDTAEQLARKAQLFSLHKTVGVAAFFVALARILWALTQPRPAPLHPDREGETLLAEVVHWSLYGAMVVVPLSGWVHHAASTGFAPILWPLGQSLPLVPKSVAVETVAASIHWVFTKVLIASLLLHVLGALKHVFIDRDGTLARMWFDSANIPTPPAREGRHVTAAVTALAIYAVGFGAAALMAQSKATTADLAAAPVLEAPATGWAVTEGTLGITVQQFGAAVDGSFADWTAAITFDETPDAEGRHGTVTVEIAIASLTLGSVTKEALGADFFNAAGFPTARFQADILAAEDGYVADGTLTLRGVEQPVSLPFALTLDGDTAEMTGSTTLDRRSYEIGNSQTDPATLGFEVAVTVDLTAQRVRDAAAAE